MHSMLRRCSGGCRVRLSREMKHAAISILVASVVSGCAHIPLVPQANAPVAQFDCDRPPNINIRNLLPQQDPSHYWRLRSLLTTADVEAKFAAEEWIRGMSLGELSSQFGSVPLGTLETMIFALADGTLTCDLNRNYLQSWRIRKDLAQTENVQPAAERELGDPHLNAYFRAQSYVQHVVFLSVPLDDIPGAIHRAESATYSDLVGTCLQREEDLFIHGCSCGLCRRPVSSITDPAQRSAAKDHHDAWAQTLRNLAKRLDAQSIQPPSHLKPLVIEKMPCGYMEFYIPLEDIEKMERAEQRGHGHSPPAP